MSYKFESEVIKAFEGLLETSVNYDVIIYIGEKPDFKEFHAHSIFLSCRSDHFNKIFAAKDIETSLDPVRIASKESSGIRISNALLILPSLPLVQEDSSCLKSYSTF